MIKYPVIASWGMDFVSALRERPWWVRVLLKPLFGRYAYREFIGLVKSTEFMGARDYDLKEIDYNKEKTTWRWWRIKTND